MKDIRPPLQLPPSKDCRAPCSKRVLKLGTRVPDSHNVVAAVVAVTRVEQSRPSQGFASQPASQPSQPRWKRVPTGTYPGSAMICCQGCQVGGTAQYLAALGRQRPKQAFTPQSTAVARRACGGRKGERGPFHAFTRAARGAWTGLLIRVRQIYTASRPNDGGELGEFWGGGKGRGGKSSLLSIALVDTPCRQTRRRGHDDDLFNCSRTQECNTKWHISELARAAVAGFPGLHFVTGQQGAFMSAHERHDNKGLLRRSSHRVPFLVPPPPPAKITEQQDPMRLCENIHTHLCARA